MNEVRDIIEEYFPDVVFEYIEERVGDVMHTKADTRSLKKLGWQTKIPIREGMNECYSKLLEELSENKQSWFIKGEYDENKFIAVFNRLDRDAYEKALALNDEFKMLKAMIVGWEDILDENGNAIEFSDANLKDMQQDNYWLTSVVKAYTGSLIEDKAKN